MEKENKIFETYCWIAKDTFCENGAFGIDWTGNKGWGQFMFVLDENGVPHLRTECMCSRDNKQFAYDLMKHLIDTAIVED